MKLLYIIYKIGANLEYCPKKTDILRRIMKSNHIKKVLLKVNSTKFFGQIKVVDYGCKNTKNTISN